MSAVSLSICTWPVGDGADAICLGEAISEDRRECGSFRGDHQQLDHMRS